MDMQNAAVNEAFDGVGNRAGNIANTPTASRITNDTAPAPVTNMFRFSNTQPTNFPRATDQPNHINSH
jgi:hypothetical protein